MIFELYEWPYPCFTQREQEEAAKLYEDFVDSFGDKEEEEGKSFVRGETIQPGAGPTSGKVAKIQLVLEFIYSFRTSCTLMNLSAHSRRAFEAKNMVIRFWHSYCNQITLSSKRCHLAPSLFCILSV